MRLDQRWVGFIIGQGGETLRTIREACNVAIQIDQGTKEQGYSIAEISGTSEGQERARAMIEAKLCEIDPAKAAPGKVEEIRVEQSCVGYLLGKGGEALKAIRAESGATITVDQTTKDQGYSMLRIIGDEQSKKIAAEMVQQRLREVKPPEGRTGIYEWRIEQNYVGWLIGKGGETVKNIKAQTGASVVIDQATKDQGYSMVRVLPGPGAEAASRLVAAKLQEVDGDSNSSSEEIRVKQQFVGFLIGRGGETVRQIKDQSGASVTINQNTKEDGYSVVRLGGTPQAIAKAKSIVEHKLMELRASRGLDVPEPRTLTAAQRNADRDSDRSDRRRRGQGIFSSMAPPSCLTSPTPPPAASGALGAPGAPGNEAYDPFAD